MRQLLLLLTIGLLCVPFALAKGEPVCTDRDGDLFKVEGGTCGLVDCNDNNIFANPGRDERCQDQVDNNCDGIINEDCPECSDMRDNDNDGLVDLEDDDCESIDDSDEGPPPPPPPPECTDEDGDGFAFEGGACGQEDCDDGDPEVSPVEQEVCNNGKDDNCNGLEDELDICSEASPVLCEDSGGVWVGPLADGDCCGNDPGEFFTARVGLLDPESLTFPTGCWDSTAVDDDSTVSASLIRDAEEEWVVGQNTFFEIRPVGNEGRDDVYAVGILDTSTARGFIRQEIPQMRPNSEYVLDIDVRTLDATTAEVSLVTNGVSRTIFTVPPLTAFTTFHEEFRTGSGSSFQLELAARTARPDRGAGFDNILLFHKPAEQVLNTGGALVGCQVTDPFTLNVASTLTGQRPIVDNSADHCAVAGSFVCGMESRWIPNGDQGDRTTAADAPPGADQNASEEFMAQQCCPENFCWTGTECVESINLTENPLIQPFQVGENAYLCDSGAWIPAIAKPNPDGTGFGYCAESQCFFSTEDQDAQCVADGFTDGDDYCDAGTWTTRTKQVALTLIDMAGAGDFTLFCDSALRAVNRIDYPITSGRTAAEILFGEGFSGFGAMPLCGELPPGTPCANNICVLRWQEAGEDKVAFGVTLNEPIDRSFDLSILNLFPVAAQSTSTDHYDFCDGAKAETTDTDQFLGCAGRTGAISGGPAMVWYNDRLQGVIYGEQDIIVGNPNLAAMVTAFLRDPFDRIIDFITNLFASRGQEDYAFIRDAVTDFRTLYLSTFDDRQIRAVEEYIAGELFTTINFYNYRVNVCRAVEEFCTANERNALNGCFGHAVSCQPTIIDSAIVFNVEAKNLQPTSLFWPGLTAAIRTKDAMPVSDPIDFTPEVVVYGPQGERLNHPISARQDTVTARFENRNPSLDEELIGYTWDFGDGTTISTSDPDEEPSHRYMTAGTYEVTLSALDRSFSIHRANPFLVTVTSLCDPGDASGDGVVNCVDTHCVVQTAVGRPVEGCPYVDICGDIAPSAEPDGLIDVQDVVMVIDLTEGQTCPNCENQVQDLDEEGVDCGGGYCSDCPTCDDGLWNQELGETDVDCGGETCEPRCGPGQQCGTSADCMGGYQCMVGECAEHHCSNGIRDADETGVDCGGAECATCPPAQNHCTNGIQDVDETGVDCGGAECSDCQPPGDHCTNGVQDGGETGVDCGGVDCAACAPPPSDQCIQAVPGTDNIPYLALFDVYGSNIVWVDSTSRDITLFDASTQQTRRLTNTPLQESDLAIHGNRVAFSNPYPDGTEEVAWILTTGGDLHPIFGSRTQNEEEVYDVDVVGDKIAWEVNTLTGNVVTKTEIFRHGVGCPIIGGIETCNKQEILTFTDGNLFVQFKLGGNGNALVYRRGDIINRDIDTDADEVVVDAQDAQGGLIDMMGGRVAWTHTIPSPRNQQTHMATSLTDTQLISDHSASPDFDDQQLQVAYMGIDSARNDLTDAGRDIRIRKADGSTRTITQCQSGGITKVKMGGSIVTWIGTCPNTDGVRRLYYRDLNCQ